MDDLHDAVVAHVAATRFPFAGQRDWPSDYRTIVNRPVPGHRVDVEWTAYYPDIVIVDGTGRVREIGEVEGSLSASVLRRLAALANAVDRDTGSGEPHLFVYVPAGSEGEAQAMLGDAGIGFAGLRGYMRREDGSVAVVPYTTPGDQKDHKAT